MIASLHTRKLTQSEQIVLDWNRKPRLIKRVRAGLTFAALAATAVCYSVGLPTPMTAEATSNAPARGDVSPAAKLTEIQQLRPQTTSGLIPLYRSALPALSIETVCVNTNPIS